MVSNFFDLELSLIAMKVVLVLVQFGQWCSAAEKVPAGAGCGRGLVYRPQHSSFKLLAQDL